MKKTAKNTLYIFFALLAFGAQAKENVNHDGGGVTSPLQTFRNFITTIRQVPPHITTIQYSGLNIIDI